MIENIFVVGSIGSVLFSCWLVLFGATGWVKHVRDEKAKFKKKLNWKAVLGMLIFIAFLLGILVWGNLRLKTQLMLEPTVTQLFLNGFGIFFFIHLYDLLIIDYLLIVKWHPKFLKLPDTEYYNSIKPHVKGFIRGIPIGLIGSVIATLISVLI